MNLHIDMKRSDSVTYNRLPQIKHLCGNSLLIWKKNVLQIGCNIWPIWGKFDWSILTKRDWKTIPRAKKSHNNLNNFYVQT